MCISTVELKKIVNGFHLIKLRTFDFSIILLKCFIKVLKEWGSGNLLMLWYSLHCHFLECFVRNPNYNSCIPKCNSLAHHCPARLVIEKYTLTKILNHYYTTINVIIWQKAAIHSWCSNLLQAWSFQSQSSRLIESYSAGQK